MDLIYFYLLYKYPIEIGKMAPNLDKSGKIVQNNRVGKTNPKYQLLRLII